MNRPILTFLLLLALLPAAVAETQTAPSFLVITRADNPTPALRREELADIFLKKARRWKDGSPVAVVDQSLTSEVRGTFCEAILRQGLLSVQHYWRQQVFSGRGAPPPVRLSDAEVLAFLTETPGSVGYVSGATPLGPGVKVLGVLD